MARHPETWRRMRFEAKVLAFAKEGGMHYVYFLRSIFNNDQTCIGVTDDLKRRFHDHNTGQSSHTSKFMPWKIELYHAFDDKIKAYAFEKYLKTGSGKAFAKRHF